MTAREYIEALPSRIKPEAIEGHNVIFHFDIPGQDGGEFTLEVVDGKATVLQGFQGEAKCKVTSKDTDFVNIATGKDNPMMAFMMGKIKVTNQGEMLKYAKVLGLM